MQFAEYAYIHILLVMPVDEALAIRHNELLADQ